jgi:hypothetical protein
MGWLLDGRGKGIWWCGFEGRAAVRCGGGGTGAMGAGWDCYMKFSAAKTMKEASVVLEEIFLR